MKSEQFNAIQPSSESDPEKLITESRALALKVAEMRKRGELSKEQIQQLEFATSTLYTGVTRALAGADKSVRAMMGTTVVSVTSLMSIISSLMYVRGDLLEEAGAKILAGGTMGILVGFLLAVYGMLSWSDLTKNPDVSARVFKDKQ